MQIEQITKLNDFEALKSSWDITLQKSPANSVFLTYDWLHTWLCHFGSSAELYVLVAREGPEIIGIAPLMWRNREGFRRLATIGQETLDYENLILVTGADCGKVVEAFVAFLLADSSWDLIQFNRIPENTGTLGLLKQVLDQTTIMWTCNLAEISPFISISDEWQSYWMRLSKGFRSNIRNRSRQLERDFDAVGYHEVACEQDIERAIELLTNLHRQRRQHVQGEEGLFVDTKNREFYLDLSKNLYHAKRLRIPYMSVREETVAVQLNFEYAGTYYKKLPAFNMDYSKYGVGDLLNVHVLEQCFEKKLVHFDFLIGGESYKFKYLPDVKSLFAVSLFASTKRGWLARQWFQNARPALKRNTLLQRAVAKSKVILHRV